MLAWQTFLKQLTLDLGEIGRLSPRVLAGCQNVSRDGQTASRPPGNARESIGLTGAAAGKCGVSFPEQFAVAQSAAMTPPSGGTGS